MFSVIKLAFQCLPERYNPGVFNHFYESFPQGFIVAKQHHKIIGFIAGLKTLDAKVKILMIAVKKKYRRQGIGSALISTFLDAALTQNTHIVELEVRTTNRSALYFYKTHGFIIVETLPRFYQNKDDAYIMRKTI